MDRYYPYELTFGQACFPLSRSHIYRSEDVVLTRSKPWMMVPIHADEALIESEL